LDGALAAISAAVTFARESGETIVLSDLISFCGELHLAQSGSAAAVIAEASFLEAIALAQAQQSKLHELRATTSLARLWRDQGKQAEAQDALQPVYGWFRDGFDAPDLARARAVLDGLSANHNFAHA
jgi:predicted ATPase